MSINLLPLPQKLVLTGGTFTLPEQAAIALDVPVPADLFFTARCLQESLRQYGEVEWQIAGGSVSAALTLVLDHSVGHPEGYHLTIQPSGISLVANDARGAFYGVMTLVQLAQMYNRRLPTLEIEDWPDFPVRGVMLDISRDRVPTMETLYHLIDLLASWKINQFQLYTEHTFAYQRHRVVWEHASPITAEQILALDAYCRERYIELVPNQNSFGHMHRWFKHAPYKALAETETEFLSPWGNMLPPFSLSPAVPGVLNLLEELYAELLPNFTSGMFNVGCDETVDLGLGRSKTLVEQKGKGRVYLDFLLEIYRRVQSHGRTMQFWGDIINQYPELVREIPGNTIALEWGYEADHDFPGKSKLFADSGVPFYVCPGTSSWRTIAGRTDNCIGNILNAVENGLKHGATGVLNTDWGDEGHWQSLPISYLGFAYGAAMSWAYTQNLELNLPAALDAFAFRDRAGVMGQLAADLGNAYRIPGLLISNSSLMFTLYQRPLNKIRAHFGSTADDDRQLIDKLQAVIDYVGGVIGKLPGAQMAVPDADLIQREFALAARMLIHGAKRGLLQINGGGQAKHALAADLETIEAEYREVWLARNCPGGLDDSARRLTQARGLYQE